MENTLSADLEAAISCGGWDEILAATLRFYECQAGTIHWMRDGVLHLVAHSGIPAPVVALVESVPVGKGIAGLAAERREAITLCNLQTDVSGQARPAAKSTGLEGSIAVPMLAGDEVRGVLGIAKATAHDWSEAEIASLMIVGARSAAAAAADHRL